MSFSRRTQWDLRLGPLAARVEALRARGASLVDLTESNPTRCGLTHSPEALVSALTGGDLATYDPDPRGLMSARAAVARYYAERDTVHHLPRQSTGSASAERSWVSAEQLLLTSSTSEGYGYLFKLLCDPGDSVLVPQPAYPLLEFLSGMEAVTLRPYALSVDDDFALHPDALLEAADERTRAVIVVSPANPTGRCVRGPELSRLAALCAERGWALIVDEVFADYVSNPADDLVPTVADLSLPCLTFALSGLSKIAALPQLKLGWIVVTGPDALRQGALDRLEVIADSYLPVSSPVQLGAERLLALAPPMQQRVRTRLVENRAALARARSPDARWDLLPSDGGWSAVVRVPREPREEQLALSLLDAGVVVQPGYFYDFPRGQYLVLSLLPEPARFAEGARRLADGLR